MEMFLFVPYYTRWHYTRGMRDFVSCWTSILHLLIEFFALETVIDAFGEPWRARQQNGLMLAHYHPVFRLGHLCIQIGLLICGYIALILAMLLGLLLFVVWIFFPVIILFTLALSFHFFLS